MKHDHFFDAGSFGLSCASLEFGDVRVANRAINEAPELQMDKALYVGELYGLPGHGFHHRGRVHVSWLEFHHYIGGFSGAGGMLVLGNRKLDPKTDYNGVFADPAAFSKKVHLLWLGVGTNEPERMRGGLQRLHASLLEANIQHVFYESPGTDHEWQTWRRDLKDFAPRLF